MNKRKLSIIASVALLAAGIGVQSVSATIATYRGGVPCGKLPAMVTLLQAANFVPSANCGVPKNGKCSNSACTIAAPSGVNKQGKCTYVPTNDSCACK